jgi:CBS domain-containing protein
MERKVSKIEGKKPISEAVDQMIKDNVWSLLITNNGVPTGVVTDRDVLKKSVAKGTDIKRVAISTIMTTPIITVKESDTMEKAMGLMVEKQIRRLYVSDGSQIVGRVTQTELFKSTFDVMEGLSRVFSQV